MHRAYVYVPDEFEPLNLIQNGDTDAIFGLLKPIISPAQFDRFLPNFAGRCTEPMDMSTMSLNL